MLTGASAGMGREFFKNLQNFCGLDEIWIIARRADRLEEMAQSSPAVGELLELTDILIDGLYVQDLRDLTLQFRGSSNQRVIDMNETRNSGEIAIWHD